MGNLSAYSRNVTSQGGEDGIIEELINRIGEGTKKVIEFGAWDGKYLSNGWNLWHERGFSALLIESDPKRAATLRESVADRSDIIVKTEYVESEGDHSLENIINRENFGTPDVLSIDIDGDDYYIFESLKEIQPNIIVIEYNPTFPPHISFVQKKGGYIGSSARSIIELGHEKGYRLAALTATNCIFVSESVWSKVAIDEETLPEYKVNNHTTQIVTGYDGKVYLTAKVPYNPTFNGHLTDVSKQISQICSTPLFRLKLPVTFIDWLKTTIRRFIK